MIWGYVGAATSESNPRTLRYPRRGKELESEYLTPDKVWIRLRSETAPGTEELRPERAADAHQQGWRSLPANAVGARCAAHSRSVWRRLPGTDSQARPGRIVLGY